MADVSASATSTNVVVICHIDVEDELFFNGSEGTGISERFAVARVGGVYWANFETGRKEL